MEISEENNIIIKEDNKLKNLLDCNEIEENFTSGKEFSKINERISNLLDKEFEIPEKIDIEKAETKNFIFTDNAIKKLKEIKYYISHNYPVLLEGPTGTAKTKSVEILCKEMGLTLKRFNLSSETKTADLFGRYAGDPNSLSGISFQEGVFIEAFKKGYTLLLDEINLASNQVLQSFEECLDSHKISCEIPGMPWKEIEMGKGFNIIATQNPNKGLFANKRQDLGKKFLSRFHVINFESFQKDELYQIAKGLGDKNNIPKKILKELVDFHDEWSNLEERKNDILCFTIREIEATINAISNGENIREAILYIYGSRYKLREYEKLKKILGKYKNLCSNIKKSELKFKNDYLYLTPQLENVLKAVRLSFNNNRHIMIVGDEGTGKSQIAKYIAEDRDKISENNMDGICYCQCTEDLKCSDLIGNQYPSLNSSKENSHQLMEWKDGFLTMAIKKGKCCILDNIEEAPATITERLNGLLDKKLEIEKDRIFEIPECPQNKEIEIDQNFRLICICNYDSISKMSPAFLNRFDVITLEDQLKPYYKDLKKSKPILLEFIDTLMKQHSLNYQSNMILNEIKEEEANKIQELDDKILSKFFGDLDDLKKKEEVKKIDFKYEYNQKLNELIFDTIFKYREKCSLSIYQLSLFCRAVYIFIHKLDPEKKLDQNKLVNYAFRLIISQRKENEIKKMENAKKIDDLDSDIENFIFNNFLNHELKESNDNKFYFRESPKLKSFMAKLFAASMINLHICVIGRTGVGKTSCAREFSRIRKICMKLSEDFYMHSFHSNTKPSHFYGNITMKNNKIEFINGSLINAMEKGTTFIADEMNLSPDIVMKSLVPALDLNLNCKIFIPGILNSIKINQNFFFIACQNDFSTTGRNSLPKLLSKKLKCIPYPEPPLKDIQIICSSINLELYDGKIFDMDKRIFLIKQGYNIAEYMDKLNNLKLPYIPNWSIRDITKILKRVHFQSSKNDTNNKNDKNNKNKFDNISFVDNIVFYTLSGIYKKDLGDPNTKENLLKNILNILTPIFKLNKEAQKNIEDIFTKRTEISEINGELFLKKGKCGISLELYHLCDKIKNIFTLPSLYNELFQILLAHDEEPILIVGETGYKTYLAKLILEDVKPIQLNAETTIGQLLGSTIFLSDADAKIFYLKQIYNILDIQPNDEELNMVKSWANFDEKNLKEIIEEQNKFIEKINDKIINNERIKKFKFTLDILKNKLINNSSEKKKHLNNINLEFKPGLILDSILSGKSLILKYLSNLPTVVLERFNELFSGKHNLTLTEDIHDTFTEEGKKEFSNLGENFRIFATCSLGEQNKLSEAVLSRFTLICSDKYSSLEQKDVLKSFISNNKLNYDQYFINEVLRFQNNLEDFSLTQMINALSLCNQKEIYKDDDYISRMNLLYFFLYRIAYGLSYKIKDKPDNIFYNIEDKLKSCFPKNRVPIITGEDINEEPLFVKDGFLQSKYNKLRIECGKNKESININIKELAFTKTFTEMIDYIHSGIATKTPVILEGGTGLGKQTAINYVANKLNYKIINFIITQSSKIEDLLGRNQIIRKDDRITVEFRETKILKALVGDEGNDVIIVFHNLNKASSALMESLCSIFNKNQTNILRPDGKSETKSKINLIGIINSTSNIAIKDKLPISLINCVFYYILPKLYPNEIEGIIKKRFKENDLIDEIPEFVECFNKSREFSYTKGNISYFSLNDITKYILFRKETKESLDKSFILQIIFAYRFIQSEFIKDIMDELGFLSMKINPYIRNKDDYLSLSIKNRENKKEIKLEYYNQFKINKDELFQRINTLNIKQKQCILFLALSIICKRACIIQGDTAAGKTHLIRLFAQMLGQKLIVYQINKETGISIFTGQSTLLNHLEEGEIKIIENYFEILSKNKTLDTYIKNSFFENNVYNNEIIKKKWTVKEFNNLIKEIKEYIRKNNENMEIEEYKEFKRIANELEELIKPYKRFKKNQSIFIEALKNGYWVLIDGIESANPIISDKLVRLCDENAELDLTETGEDLIFSKNSTNKIHKNFHLFINYNPFNKYNNNQLNEMFLNKCITFTLVPMDVDIESSAQIIYGFMKNSNRINDSLCQEISSKVAIIHREMNKKVFEDQDFFSGGAEFTGRIIKYISEEISKSEDEDDLCQHLINAFYLNYINSINNKNDIKNINEVKNIIKKNLEKFYRFDTGEKNIYLKYSEIFKILRNIQKVAKEIIKEFDFNFKNFLVLLRQIEIGNLDIIYYYIDETLQLLDVFVGNSIKKKRKYFNYYNLEIIKKILRDILDYVKKNSHDNNLNDFCLNNEEELINKNILIKEFAKFKLISRLKNLPENFIILPDLLLEYIISIKKLLSTNDIKDLYENLNIVKKFIDSEINVTQLFPFNQILLEKNGNNGRKIRMFKIIFLIYKMIEYKVNFQFDYNSTNIKFIFNNSKKYQLEFFNELFIIINLDKDFYFENSKIIKKTESQEKLMFETPNNFDNNDQKILATNSFYIICSKLLEGEFKIDEREKFLETFSNVFKKNIRIIDEIDNDFKKEIKDEKRTYRITKLISKSKGYLGIEDDELIMKIWYLILFYDEDKLALITPDFCLPFEKELLEGMKKIYDNIDIKIINEIIYFTENIKEENKITGLVYGNSKTFLYQIQAGFYKYESIKNEDKKNLCQEIENEIKWYSKIKSPLEEFWKIENSIQCLETQYYKLQEYIERVDQAEKYKNKINELISRVKDYNFEENERNKEKLIQLLRSQLENPTKEIYESCQESVDNYIKDLSYNLENKIIFPFDITDNLDEKDLKESIIICLSILKSYSINHRLLSNIFSKKKNILSEIFQLDKELEIISNILTKYALNNIEYIQIYKEKVMGIIRAYILYKIIIFGKTEDGIKSLFKKFLKLPEIINDQIGGIGNNYYNKTILKWTKTFIQTDLEEYLLIPQFEPKDFLYLFLITYFEEKEEKYSKGFLFKNVHNEKVELILFQSLKQYELMNLKKKEKQEFENYIENIGRTLFKIFFPEKCEDNFDELSFQDLKKKFKDEKAQLKTHINDLKKDNKPFDKEVMNKKIIKYILACFTLVTTYKENYEDIKLTYEDINFFKNQYWNEQLMSIYPGMAFWLLRYYSSFYINLLEKKDGVGCFVCKDNQISFWYFQIRIISNTENFEYNCYKKKTVEIHNNYFNVGKELEEGGKSNSLKKKVEELIKNKIKSLIKEKKPVNVNWLNLVLNDLPPEIKITNKILRHFYEYFAILLADSNEIQKELKNEILLEYIIQVFDLIFQNKIEEIFDKDIDKDKNEIIKLINKPQEELIKKINELNQKNLLNDEISINIEQTNEITVQIKKEVPSIIENICNKVSEKTEEYRNIFLKDKEKRMKEEMDNIQKNIETAKKEINDCLDVIQNKELQDQKLLKEKILDFQAIMENKGSYFKFTKEKVTIFYELLFKLTLTSGNIYQIKIKNRDNKNEKIDFDNKCRCLYIQSSVFREEDLLNFTVSIKDKNSLKKINIKDKIEIKYYDINAFVQPMDYDPNAKEKMLNDVEYKIDRLKPKITFNGHKFKRVKLDDFMKLVNNFDINLLRNIKYYDEKLKKKINIIIDAIDDLNRYLNVKTSNGKENDSDLVLNIRNLKNLILNYKEKLLININGINKFISLNKNNKDYSIFIEDHDKIVALYEKKKYENPLYISNVSYLQYPMISDNGKAITFSSESFQMFLGSYIPSILSSPFIIKLLNIKENIIKPSIIDCDKNIVTVEESDSENTIRIHINIQNLSTDKLIEENIKFKLKLSSENLKETIIDFNLSLNLVPLSIIFSSKYYKLIYDSSKNIFKFNCPKVYANSNIKFNFAYLYASKYRYRLNNNIVDFEYSVESLEKNASKKPELDTQENELIIKIPKNENIEDNLINFILKIYFTSSFYINILFDSKIEEFEFNFKFYSYDKKRFTSDEDIKIYIDEESIHHGYKIYFKIENSLCKTEYELIPNLPKDIEIIETDFEEKKTKKDFIFFVKFGIKNRVSNHGKYFLKIKGNQIEKIFDIIFPEIIDKRTNLIEKTLDFPRYKYIQETNEFIEEKSVERDCIYITPFNYYIPYANNLYAKNDKNETKPNFDPNSKFAPITLNDIEVLGIFNQKEWYPIIRMEKEDKNSKDIFLKLEYLKYEESSTKKAKKFLELIDEKSDYWYFPRFIKNCCEKKNKVEFLRMNQLLPPTIKKEISEEVNLLRNLEEDEEDIYYPIISNNLIYILFKLFKNKELEIKKNGDILYLTDMKPPENILEKIAEKRDDYFKINLEEFSNFEEESNKKEIELDKKIEGNKAFLIQENENPKTIENLNQIILKEEKVEMKEKDSEKFDISDISLIELKYPNKNSINEIIEYYNNCIKITNILYFYIISASKSNNHEKQIIARNYFMKLYSIFTKLKYKLNYSFFALDINEFLNGFYNLYLKLEKIGVNIIKNIDVKKGNNEENYIILPYKNVIIKSSTDYWSTKNNLNDNRYRQEEAQIGKLYVNKLDDILYNVGENDYESDEEKETINYDEKKEIIDEKLKIDNIKIVDIDDNRIINNLDEKKEKKFIDNKDIKKEKKQELKIGKISDKLITIDPININEKNFNEDDGIKRALLVLEEEKRKKDSNIPQKLDLGNPKRFHKFKNKKVFEIDKSKKINIAQLYTKASFMANQLFIKINLNGKVKYFETLVVILLDPSVYISEEIKALNMFIVCAITNALNCLEIKYSIILMGDEDFRCVLKDHKEPHSIEALERVYECLMLKRFRTNIPGCIKYSLEQVKNYTEFKYTSFFIFTDGLDKSFIYTQKDNWDSNIFYKKSNSFGFIFLLSSILTKPDREFLKKIWTTFLNETKRNSRSTIFLKSLELAINDEFKRQINDIFVLNLLRSKKNESIEEFKFLKPLFEVKIDNSILTFLKNSNNILDDKSLFNLNGSYIRNEIISPTLNANKDPLESNYFTKNNLHQIADKTNKKQGQVDTNIVNFTQKFLSIKHNLNRSILEEIFKPNKANLKILSNTGTEIDIMALILYFLNPVPDPMIYLQDAIGNEKEYAISIIIDTSFSVFNHININHSLNTIRVILSAFTLIDLPSFDLVVTGEKGPIVLCSEYSTFAALNEKSPLWELLYQSFSNPVRNADLLSALHTVFNLKRMRNNNFPSFLFVLTDGLFQEEQQKQLKEFIAQLIQTNLHIIGIGLGVYPYGISKIFGQFVYDINPNNLLHSILSIIEGNMNDKNEMNYIQKEEDKEKDISSAYRQLIGNKNFCFYSLREELKQSPLTTNCYDMLSDEINAGYDKEGRPINPEGDNIGLFKPNSLSGQKILIVMLWSCALSGIENKLLDPRYIEETNESNSKCIKNVVEYLGVKVKTVLNYEDAIKEITKKDEKGKCNYYTVWVMCGPDINRLPDNSRHAGLVEQFIDCLLLYWENGGGVVLFCDNDPLYFQANMFLKKIRFKRGVERTKLRIKGNDLGGKNLLGVNANGNLQKNATYDTSKIRLPNGTERVPLGLNTPNIYEGETISHANNNNLEEMKPFIPFAKNSSGNICIMIYSTHGKEGDIIIDCGYTKVFINMCTNDTDTWRYIQNITCFLARPEAHMIYDDGETAKNYRPNGVNFTINYFKLYTQLKPSYLDIVYMIDSTGSMGSWISGVKNKCNNILENFNKNEIFKNYDIQFGGVFYRDPVDESSDIHEYQPLGSVYSLKNKMSSIIAKGGGDAPEDWVGGYELALNNMGWREKSIKIIIHIADAGAHTLRFSDGDTKHNDYNFEIGLISAIKRCASQNINIFAYQIGDEPKKSFRECKYIYDGVKSQNCSFNIYQFEHASEKEVAEKLEKNITNHISAFIARN